jgi:hypothetical protein
MAIHKREIHNRDNRRSQFDVISLLGQLGSLALRQALEGEGGVPLGIGGVFVSEHCSSNATLGSIPCMFPMSGISIPGVAKPPGNGGHDSFTIH